MVNSSLDNVYFNVKEMFISDNVLLIEFSYNC